MVSTIDIAGRRVGDGHPCFVIAEAGVNHNGNVDLAHRLIDAAVTAKADAVKFQTFKTEKLASQLTLKADYQRAGTNTEETSQVEMLRALELTASAFADLKRHCDEARILFLSTPFDLDSAAMLSYLGMAMIKVPSGELTNHPFLRRLAAFRLPMVLSTGMADLAEISDAVGVIREDGGPALALLHCVSSYPTPADQINLKAIATLQQTFALPVGFSDHSLGITAPIAATALGAAIIEKHFTLDRAMSGPDHAASLEPNELREMIAAIRDTSAALGTGEKRAMPCEENVRSVARRSLIAARDLVPGSVISEQDVAILRPGTGIPPRDLERLIGCRLLQSVAQGTLFSWNMVEAP